MNTSMIRLYLLSAVAVLGGQGCFSFGPQGPIILPSELKSECPDISGRYRYLGDPLPGGERLSRFNAKLTIANVALVGGGDFIREDRIRYFDLIQQPGSIAISFQAPDGSLRKYFMTGKDKKLLCTANEVILEKNTYASGEAVTGTQRIVHRLSTAPDRSLIIKTDMTGWSWTLFIIWRDAPERYYASFARVNYDDN